MLQIKAIVGYVNFNCKINWYSKKKKKQNFKQDIVFLL
jgi:hypothetical protein